MDKKDDEKTGYKPDITNYDYVWGSDQDEYVNEELKENETTKQEINLGEK